MKTDMKYVDPMGCMFHVVVSRKKKLNEAQILRSAFLCFVALEYYLKSPITSNESSYFLRHISRIH